MFAFVGKSREAHHIVAYKTVLDGTKMKLLQKSDSQCSDQQV